MQQIEDIHIALSIYEPDGQYSRHAGVVMVSVMKNTERKVCFHILHDDTLLIDNRKKLIEICDRYDGKILFHKININEDVLKAEAIKYFSPGTLFRLFIADCLNNVEKVIYLDCDIICQIDISNFWSKNIDEYAIAAVPDVMTYYLNGSGFKKQKFYNKMQILNENYFNAGALLLNLKKIRLDYDLREDGIRFLIRYPDAPYLDQDSLNFMFQKDCLILDDIYNKSVQYTYFKDKEKYSNEQNWQDVCWHFNNPAEKPWKIRITPIESLYWEYFSMTPWGNSVEKFMKYYSQVDVPLEEAIKERKIVSRKKFLKQLIIRMYKEMKQLFFL